MVPPKKKRKVVLPEPSADDENSCMDIIIAEETAAAQISRKDILTKKLIDQLDVLESGGKSSAIDGDASVSLLRLKSLQRSVLKKMRQTQELLKLQGLARDRQESRIENLRYQQEIHQKSQKGSDRAVESTTLEIAALIRRTSQPTNTNVNAIPERTTEEDNKDLLNNFLGDDWKDPSRRETIVAKLNHEVITRKKLEDELDNLKADRKSKQVSLASRQKLLRDLPSKLADMEKASISLQKFCQKQSTSSSSSSSSPLMTATPKLGTTKRRNRLDLAKTLPKALYTLFHQLQSCLDVMEMTTNQGASLEKIAGIAPEALPTVEIQRESSSDIVLLKIPIPTLSPGGEMSYRPKKETSLLFRYDANLDSVLAACGTDYGMGPGVIDELFPGDKGDEFLSRTTNETAATTDFSSPSHLSLGKPYQWCNYLGGLHISPGEQTAAKMHASARVIVRALVRRVRATTTLSWILHGLSRKPSASDFPQHPAFLRETERESSDTKLSSWTVLETDLNTTTTNNNNNNDDDDDDDDKANRFVRVYKAILQNGNGEASSTKKEQIVAKVSINLARYPSSIPQWKILCSTNEEQEQDSLDVLRGCQKEEEQLPLYSEALARLEQEVNQDVDRLVVSSDQTTYDWILAQQLAEIAKGWEDSLQEIII